jgi:hypothetical protein
VDVLKGLFYSLAMTPAQSPPPATRIAFNYFTEIRTLATLSPLVSIFITFPDPA